MATPDLNLATQHPTDPTRLIIVHLGPIALDHATIVAHDFLQTYEILPIALQSPQPTLNTYPISYRSLNTHLFASIDAPSLEVACYWLDLLTCSCVMFNP